VNQTSPAERNQGQEGRAAPIEARPNAAVPNEAKPKAEAARPSTGGGEARRPMRADAARNVARLIAAAREAFAEHGSEASLDDIARLAGVGPGTLYRHFPNRATLVEAVYLEGVRTLCEEGDRLLDAEPPVDALVDWLRALTAYVTTKRGLGKSLLGSLDNRDQIFRRSHEMIEMTGAPLLDRAKASGAIRPDLELMDLIRLANAVAIAGEQAPDGAELSNRLLLLAVDGLRTRAG
jgi:AcrR family transcriptional regulator